MVTQKENDNTKEGDSGSNPYPRISRESNVFPKRTAWAAIIATLVFIGTQFYFQVSNRKAFRNIYEIHFPIVERNSINLRLHERIMALVELAVSKGDSHLEEEHEIFMDALKQNQELTQYALAPAKELGRAYHLPARDTLSSIEKQIFALLKQG
ncbi:MAG: hypothetical protein KDD43_08425, partial [Bdellovibrionales bacterium]|nr:hypothetical protein [Bdellovibrionales bacterium]